MSSKNNMFGCNLKNNIILENILNIENNELNKAIICQSNQLIKWCNRNRIVTIKPGINIDLQSDNINQTYTNPANISNDEHATMYVIGRGITNSDNPIKKIKEYLNT